MQDEPSLFSSCPHIHVSQPLVTRQALPVPDFVVGRQAEKVVPNDVETVLHGEVQRSVPVHILRVHVGAHANAHLGDLTVAMLDNAPSAHTNRRTIVSIANT
eukprot:8333899-Pyramimonas_sp.AAC.1